MAIRWNWIGGLISSIDTIWLFNIVTVRHGGYRWPRLFNIAMVDQWPIDLSMVTTVLNSRVDLSISRTGNVMDPSWKTLHMLPKIVAVLGHRDIFLPS